MDYKYKYVLVEKKDKIATVTINRPEALNAVSFELHRDLAKVFEDLAWDDDVWVVILTGAGKAFSAGGDINWFKARYQNPDANPMPPVYESVKIVANILELPKPVIAAVNGAAIGLGSTLAFACDIIVVAENARIADMHVNVGLAAGDGGAVLWPLLMGMAKAKEHLYTGDPLNPRDAERMGIVNKVVPADQVMTEAMAYAKKLAAGSPLAIKHTKIAVNREAIRRLHDILPGSLAMELLNFYTKDHIEAVNAFLEKRKPTFTGK